MKSLLSSIGAVATALLACTCCVGPLLALAGMLGATAAQLVWLASIKPYLITGSLLIVSYNLYRAYFPSTPQVCCEINTGTPKKELSKLETKSIHFFSSKLFLWIVAALTVGFSILPYIFN